MAHPRQKGVQRRAGNVDRQVLPDLAGLKKQRGLVLLRRTVFDQGGRAARQRRGNIPGMGAQ
jgi:hypothetical protein